MSVVKINAITVPREDFDEFVCVLRTPAEEMPDAEGFVGRHGSTGARAEALWRQRVRPAPYPSSSIFWMSSRTHPSSGLNNAR